ncbi:hypothetical protein JD844_023168 [Phrynosoma platyrhinos]|uniref:Caspase-10 n=1 Tax=Phrynosoma platyrhinos TaxID=52577 RepID=A0ABQ7SW29_PHRPL|nr:hypothetical protein JD844_023168 [Phrynosoma platyrhinos]
MEEDSMKFRQQLLAIDDNLGKEDVDALKFLCSDFISLKKLETVEAAHDIFQLLIKKNLLNKENTFLIAELLYRIKCIFLLQKIGYTKEEVQDNLPLKGMLTLLNFSYRQMLYEISEELTEEDVKTAMFLLREQIPKKQSTTSALELLTSLEKQDLLAETKTDKLEIICEKISPDLLKKVERYKQRTADSYTEELGSLRWHSESLHSLPANQESVWSEHFGFVSSLSDMNPLHRNALMLKELCWFLLSGMVELCFPTSDCYKMDGLHRGYCLIFNNINFEGGLNQRKGSQKDAMELESVFTWLGLEVKQYDDKTSVEMENILKDWQSCESWKDRDCLVCCILSHGESGKIYGTDAHLIPIRTIMSYFTAKRCPQLAKKPKLFFIQACQGEKTQQPVYLETDTNNHVNLGADAQSSGFSSFQLLQSIPEEADFLLGMATVDGYLSFRHIHQGTWYIQALCNKLRALVPSGEDILSILTEVNADVSKRADTQGQKKQMPQPAYTLRKKLIFPMPK